MSKTKEYKKRKTVDESFWEKVHKTSTCWLWIGGKQNAGYGQFWDGTKSITAHRHSWVLHYGTIPEELLVLHRCDNPACVNPDHLYIGTQQDNMNDKVARNRTPKRVIHILKKVYPNS